MNKQQKEVIYKTVKYMKELLSGEGTGHDWLHIERVWANARRINKAEKADAFVVELAALLHDISDWKFNGGDETAGAKKAAAWLNKLGVESEVVRQVAEIIENSSFKGAKVKNKIRTIEGKILQDADRLDAMGAIGVARAFAYGGSKGHEIYNPEIKPKLHSSAKEYKTNKSTTINHFHEKLLLLHDLMHTKTGRKLAERRHKFMQSYLKEFMGEVA